MLAVLVHHAPEVCHPVNDQVDVFRQLLQQLGRKILVCVGDERNDLTMMDAADYAYAPSDAVIAPMYETVCPCGEGAVADVIYKKIPEILGLNP